VSGGGRTTPDGYHSATPYLFVKGAARAITFYRDVFDAVELLRFDQPDGSIGHAELRIGDSVIMLADEFPELGYRSPQTLGGSSVLIMLYVADVDARFARALAAGGRVHKPLQDQVYGDRSGTFIDPFGHLWTLATHVEDVPPDEIARRLERLTH
jgi:PhnB protein